LLQHGDRLGALFGGAQRPRIVHGGLGVAGIGAMAGAQGIEFAAPVGLAARRAADRAGNVIARGLAAGDRQSECGRGKEMGGTTMHGTPMAGVPAVCPSNKTLTLTTG
jgi:hypothetical protein